MNQSLSVNGVSLGTLTARNAITINTELVALTNSFLCKRVRYFLQMNTRTADDDGPILVCLSHGNAATGEIGLSITEHNPFGPADVTQSQTQDDAWIIWQDSIAMFKTAGDQTHAQIDSGWLKLGKNGFPALEGSGVQAWVINAGSGTLVTGAIVMGLIMIQGVWLRD